MSISRIVKGARVRNNIAAGKILGRIGSGRGSLQELSILDLIQELKKRNNGYLPGAPPAASGGSFSGARVTPSSDLTAVNYTTKTAIPFNSENFDVGSWHDNVTNNTRLTVPSGVSYVEVTGSVQTNNDTSNTWGLLQIWKNNIATGTLVGTVVTAGPTGSKNMNVTSGPLAVVAGDYFELAFQEQSDTSITILATTTWFSIKALG